MPPLCAGPFSLTLATSAPRGLSSPRRLGNLVGDRLNADPEPAAVHDVLGVADQLVGDLPRDIGRDREADADRAAARRIDRGIDADDLALAC